MPDEMTLYLFVRASMERQCMERLLHSPYNTLHLDY